MKKMFVCMLLLAMGYATTAQEKKSKAKGSSVVDLGLGLGSPYWGSGIKNSLPFNPRIALERFIDNNISIGGSVAYSSAKYNYVYFLEDYSLRYTAIFVSGRGAYHFELDNKKIDPYLGLSVGYVIVSVNDNQGNIAAAASSGIGYGVFAGARYYPSSKFGVHAELGYTSFSLLNAGVSFRL